MPDKIVDAAKLFIQYAWAVWLVTAIVLFVPAAWLSPLGVAPIVSQWRPYIGSFFLVASVLVIGHYGKSVFDKIKRDTEDRKNLAQRQSRLHRLTVAEQAVLQQYIEVKTRTQYLTWPQGVVLGLEKEGIIDNVSPMMQHGLACAYNMQEWAYTYLTDHPELVGLPRPTANADKDVQQSEPDTELA